MMPLLENQLARRIDNRVELRPLPVRVRWAFDDLVTSDGHAVRCEFECSMKALPDSTERRMLQEVLLNDRHILTTDEVAAHFRHGLRASLRNALSSKTVESALAGPCRHEILEALKSTIHPIAFSSGLEVLPPFHLDVESPSLQQQCLREMQRGLAERHAAGQVEHFQRAAELLKQFQTLRQSAPELSAGQVLEQISPADRGSVLQTLLLASARQDRETALWAVSGPYLVQIDTRVSPPKTQLTPLPPTLGPLRSVTPATVNGERVLLVGARGGFMVVRPGSSAEPTLYVDPQIDSQLGFSRVVYWDQHNEFAGCHGDAGIVRWRAGETAEPAFRLSSAQLRESYPQAGPTASPRHLHVLSGERAVFTFGTMLIGLDAKDDAFAIPTPSRSAIVALLGEDLHVLAAHEDGTVCAIDRATLEITCKQQTGSKLGLAGTLPWLGSTRLLLAGDDGPLRCIGLDDPLVTQYASGHRALCRLAGSAEVVAAVSADRQRLILWNTWDGRQPAAEIHLAGVTRHRIADIDFG